MPLRQRGALTTAACACSLLHAVWGGGEWSVLFASHSISGGLQLVTSHATYSCSALLLHHIQQNVNIHRKVILQLHTNRRNLTPGVGRAGVFPQWIGHFLFRQPAFSPETLHQQHTEDTSPARVAQLEFAAS